MISDDIYRSIADDKDLVQEISARDVMIRVHHVRCLFKTIETLVDPLIYIPHLSSVVIVDVQRFSVLLSTPPSPQWRHQAIEISSRH